MEGSKSNKNKSKQEDNLKRKRNEISESKKEITKTKKKISNENVNETPNNKISITSSIMSKNSKPKIPNNSVKPVGEKLIEVMSRSYISSIQ